MFRSTTWIRKNVGRLADCDSPFDHPIVMKYIFPRSQESNLDHVPFPIKIGRLMHFKSDFPRETLHEGLANWWNL